MILPRMSRQRIILSLNFRPYPTVSQGLYKALSWARREQLVPALMGLMVKFQGHIGEIVD